MNIDGRLLTLEQFEQHVKDTDLGGADTVVIHHTAKPDEALWAKYGGWQHWKLSLKRYYEGLGWEAGPHCYIDEAGIGLFTPLNQDGVGVSGHNLGTRHLEIVGNYTDHLPTGKTMDNAVGAAGALLWRMCGDTWPLAYHQALEPATECPGAALIARWGWFTALVGERMARRALNPLGVIKIDVTAGRWLAEELRRSWEGGDTARVGDLSLELVRRLVALERSLTE